MLFADAIPTPSGAAEIITAIGVVVTAFTGLVASIGVLYNIVQNARQAKESKAGKEAQTKDIKEAVTAAAVPIQEKLDVVEKQTNGIMDAKLLAVKQKIEDVHQEVKKVADKQ